MVEESSAVSAFESFTVEDAGGNKYPPKTEAKEEAANASEPPKKESPEPESTKPAAEESESSGDRLETALERQPKLSPAAKRLALEKGVPIGQVKGTGPGGRVTLSDVEKFKPAARAGPAGAAAGPSYEDTPASSMRKTIA